MAEAGTELPTKGLAGAESDTGTRVEVYVVVVVVEEE